MSELASGSTDFFAPTEILSSEKSVSTPTLSENDSGSKFKSAFEPKLTFEYCSLLEKIKSLNLDKIISNRKNAINQWNEGIQKGNRNAKRTRKQILGQNLASQTSDGPSADGLRQDKDLLCKDELKNIKIKILVLHSDTDSEILDTMMKIRQNSQCFKDILLLNMIDIVIFENIYSLYRYLLALELKQASDTMLCQELDDNEKLTMKRENDDKRYAKNTYLDSLYRPENSNTDNSTRINTRDIVKIIMVNLFDNLCDAGHSMYIQHQARSSNASLQENLQSDLVIKQNDLNASFLNDLMIRIASVSEGFDFSIIEKNTIGETEMDDEDSSGKFESLPLPLFAQQFEYICELHSDLKVLIQNVMNDTDGFQYESLLMDVHSNQDRDDEISLLSLRDAACQAFEIKSLEKGVNAKYVFFDEFLDRWKKT